MAGARSYAICDGMMLRALPLELLPPENEGIKDCKYDRRAADMGIGLATSQTKLSESCGDFHSWRGSLGFPNRSKDSSHPSLLGAD